MRKFFSTILILFLVSGTAVFSDSDRLLQKLKPSGYVNDFTGVMRPADRTATEQLLTELEQKSGAEVVVVILDSLDGGQIDDVANRLFAHWGIGKKGHDNGVLLLGAMKERRGNRLRIEVGYGLEGVIPDGVAGRILDTFVVPEWNQRKYGISMGNGAAALAQEIATDRGITLSGVPKSVRHASRKRGVPFINLILLLLFIPFAIRHPFLAMILLSGGRGGYRGGGFGGSGFGGFGGGLSGGGGASR